MKIIIQEKEMDVKEAINIASSEIFEHSYGASIPFSNALFCLLAQLVDEKEEGLKEKKE